MFRDHVSFRFAQAGKCGLTAMEPTRIVKSRILISISENLLGPALPDFKQSVSKNRSNWGGKTTLS
jgi:hypothetical protein